ncbi:MAG: GNAT family N-acetyltransferase [Deferrisomatales bacterium]
MKESTVKIRLMQGEDFEAVVEIDEKVLGSPRREYYRAKFEKILESDDTLPVSLVAEESDGRVVGFVMGELFMGQFGIFQERATLDTIGVDPGCQHQGVGQLLVDEFVDHLKRIGVRKLTTLVSTSDARLTRFFRANRFTPSQTINLERDL